MFDILRGILGGSSKVVLYAQPYAFDAKGWQFSSADEFDKLYKAHLPVEEYEISLVDSDSDAASELFTAMNVNQGSVRDYFDNLDSFLEFGDNEQAAIYFLMTDHSHDFDDAVRLADREVRVMQGRVIDYVDNLIDDMGGVENLSKEVRRNYFDYEMFGRDAKIDLDTADPDNEYAFEMSDYDYGVELTESIGEYPAFYFDREAFARDLRLGGDVIEFEYAGSDWVTDYR